MSAVVGCGPLPVQQDADPVVDDSAVRALLKVPAHFATPAIPDFNPPTVEKIALGRRLFYDKRLSINETQSCASCHVQGRAFADGLPTPHGATGQPLLRNSQGLANVAYYSTLTWGNNVLLTLEDQIRVPIESDSPIELGVVDGVVDEVLARFDADETYQRMFAAAFPESPTGATLNKIIHSLASFCRTMISGDSPYDRYYRGDKSAMSEAAIRGLKLFNSERLECFHCHNGVNFSVSYRDARTTEDTITYPFFNTGLYNVDGTGGFPTGNQGLFELSQDPRDRGAFRPQGLRNVALTAPYMHDGGIPTLREVILHYARGGRIIESGPNAGDGRLSPLKSGLVRGFEISEDEINDVVAFLESLTDTAFIENPGFSDPFAE